MVSPYVGYGREADKAAEDGRGAVRGLGAGALVLWLVCLFSIIGIVAFESRNYSDLGRDSLSHDLDIGSDTLYVDINEDQEEYLDDESFIDLDDKWFLMEDADAFYGRVFIDIE